MKIRRNKMPCIRIVGVVGLHSLTFILMIISILSCSDSHRQTGRDRGDIEDKKTTQNKPPASFSDTITINIPAAVFYYPDSLQLEKIKAATEAGIFESLIHEFSYQMRNSRIVLKKYYPHIKIQEVKNARYLRFKKTDGEEDIIDLNGKNDPFGIFLFDGLQSPHLVDMTNIESELGFYFSKKSAG